MTGDRKSNHRAACEILSELEATEFATYFKRNHDRFLEDFMFQLSKEETDATLNQSQIVMGSQKHRDPRLTQDAK